MKIVVGGNWSMDTEHVTLASEIMHELKVSAKRWFIAFIIMLVVETSTVIGFLWYMSLPAESQETIVENDDDNANYVGSDLNGDIYNGEDNGKKN